jgi:hypothetical protein
MKTTAQPAMNLAATTSNPLVRTIPIHRSRTMNATQATNAERAEYELRFRSLFDEGRGYAFPCDAYGRVDMDALSERARNNYFYARTVVGRELATPAVQRRTLQ